ncbi:hypothetical protein B5V01_22260 [Mesorhizobium erdmanii]|uniref:Uncharacterized protein n=2 Tax=Mesorhizobium TaxID=68287 RepID=A0A3M9X3Z7_9HYPH|nr:MULTISPECIES: beta family protein [Mesorhizobium]RNJ42739.1 hypothetical protein DNR46_26885 [Mesorhizobium japonicum]RXT42604.1 hypothetical protein B5V01_22260 [Mesorhizobium erdmanii]
MTRYIPILRWKQGERTALNHLAASTRNGVAPHVVLTQAQFNGSSKKSSSDTPPKKAPLSAAEHFAKQVFDAWGKNLFFLDAADLVGDTAKHDLDEIRHAAKKLELYLVPSARYSAPKEYRDAIRRAVKQDGLGLALRLTLSDMTSAPTWISSWPFPVAETDLIIDLGASVASVLALGSSVLTAFQALTNGAEWRSVTMTGGNIPATLTGYVVGRTMLPRSEFALWSKLVAAPLPYSLDFGDYATIGPEASTEDIGGPVPINAKYTLKPDFAVYHGVKEKGPAGKPRDQQYRAYAKDITSKLPNRFPLAYCWGDQMIDAIANSAPTAGSPTSWVSYSINRHIEITRTQLP